MTTNRFLLLLGIILFVGIQQAFAQQYQAKIIDAKTETPIVYGTIETGPNRGLITNEEGIFTVNIQDLKEVDSIYISALGYKKKGLAWRTATDSIIKLMPEAFKLKGVFLTDKQLAVEQIIDSIKAHFVTNYTGNLTQQKIFLRQSDLNRMSKADIEFKESSIEELNEALIDSVVKIIPRTSSFYRETLFDYYGTYTGHKINVIKAAQLYDKSNEGSLEALGQKLERIFKENVKPDSYLKIKSGIFGTKVQLDSVVNNNDEAQVIEVKVNDTVGDNYQETVKRQLDQVYQQLFFQEDAKLDVFSKSNRYDFELGDYTFIDDEAVYSIRFSPKGKRDFEGVMYVNTADYAVMRMEYENVRSLRRVKLLGISYEEAVFNGKLFFKKGSTGYIPTYIELVDGRNFGIKRPLKVIEKNKFVKGRRKQNELSLGLDFKNTQTIKYEFVVFDSEALSAESYSALAEKAAAKATYLSKYDPDFWKGYTIIEPNAAIRSFTVEE